MKHLATLLIVSLIHFCSYGQTQEELVAQKAARQAELDTLQPKLDALAGKVDALKKEIITLTDQTTPYPRWDLGAFGNVGLNFSNFNNWFSKAEPNTKAVTAGISTNLFANLLQPKSFWRNNANIVLGWIKFDNLDDPDDEDEFRTSADAINVSSLYGYKLSEKLALSVLGEYRSTVIDHFNDPGYLDLGAGVTWTPIQDLIVVVHPLNYNFIFYNHTDGPTYESSLGTKLVADYKHEFTNHMAWRSNLSAFASYKSLDLSNWTWVNGITTNTKGIGLGIDLGLRQNKQEAIAANEEGNPLQSYWIVGLSVQL